MAIEAMVTFPTPRTFRSFRDEAGRFTGTTGMKEQWERNRRFVDTMRASLGRRIENNLKRPGESTGRLVRMSAHQENVRYDAWSVGIGVDSWLDKQVRYWRTIEYGSEAVWARPFIGTPLYMVKRGRDGSMSDLRTPNSPETFERWQRGPRMVVKNEIAPMGIYAQIKQEAHLDEYGVRAAHNFLRRIFSEENVRIR